MPHPDASGALAYGTWPSVVDAELVATAGITLGWVSLDGDRVWWVEGWPSEGGRAVLCSSDGRGSREHTPDDHNVRTLVHEYGGLCYAARGDTVWYVNYTDQRIYRRDGGQGAVPVTPEPPAPRSRRYADLCLSPGGTRLFAVRERHEAPEVHNELVVVPADGSGGPRVLASGHDFYAAPRVSPDGTQLAWLCWDHPRMPWDGTELMVGDIDEGGLASAHRVAGGLNEAVFQPAWSPRGLLHFVSDPDGWWNLFRVGPDGRQVQLTHEEAELGVPLWNLGYATYGFLPDGRIACIVGRDGLQRLHLFDPQHGALEPVDLPFTEFHPSLAASGTRIAMAAATPTSPSAVHVWEVGAPSTTVARHTSEHVLEPQAVSVARSVSVATDGGEVHALYYRPVNPGVKPPVDERPPLLVRVHGGPTGQATAELQLATQYWTSRGFAVVDVNYAGSTGYGRAYRERLKGLWGIVDVADCVTVARYLADRDEVDPARLVIRGGSAGGYTVLRAIVSGDVFAAGASYYGISDLRLLAEETHKFESRYLDALVGDDPAAWIERAPINQLSEATTPLLILQGLEDMIVPPAQAERMVEILEASGAPYAYVTFDGEQHGFRRASTIRRALQAELSFYGQVFGFGPVSDGDVQIRNLDRAGSRRR